MRNYEPESDPQVHRIICPAEHGMICLIKHAQSPLAPCDAALRVAHSALAMLEVVEVH